MDSNYKFITLNFCLLIISFSSCAQSPAKNTIQVESNVFVPITTDDYTDSLYLQNLKKSENEVYRLNNPPKVEESRVIDIQERIKNYEIARDKYHVNSQEYRDIQSKIDRLKFENEINFK